VPRARYRTIPVKEETFSRLEELRELLQARSWDELLARLADYYYSRLEEETRLVVCQEFREARGTLSAWARTLKKRLGPDRALYAVQLLKPLEDKTTYVVDPEKCPQETLQG